jgi:hypothetical protein
MRWRCERPGHWVGYERNPWPGGTWAPEGAVVEARRVRTTGNARTWVWRIDPLRRGLSMPAHGFRTLRAAKEAAQDAVEWWAALGEEPADGWPQREAPGVDDPRLPVPGSR